MGDYTLYLEAARKYTKTADHLLTNTFPLVKDPKMLLTVLHNIFRAYSYAMMFMLYRDVEQGKIPPFAEDFQSMFDVFKARAERRYKINPEYIQIIEDINETLIKRKESPMEFSRHEMYVICSGQYETKTVTTKMLRDYISKAKLFIDEIDTGIVKHG